VEDWQEAATNCLIENMYGPTEATVFCGGYRWDPVRSPQECVNGTVPIGNLFNGHEGIIVDEFLNNAPPGEAGELCISGPQVFSGYWRNAELSAERLVRLRRDEPTVFYRTGDLVRSMEGPASYSFVGRTDHEFKVRGERVDAGEIEAALREFPGVMDAVAARRSTGEGTLAFVTLKSRYSRISAAIWPHLRQRLPDHIVPEAVYFCTDFPRNMNGKIDKQALIDDLSGEGEMPPYVAYQLQRG
jgi:acyl-coenzyme A synthetase/AMP-(fatty) acid ligase